MLRKVRELVAICPGCKAWETMLFKVDIMEQTSRFSQGKDGSVYHDCQLTDMPCRLYPRFIGERV